MCDCLYVVFASDNRVKDCDFWSSLQPQI
jgi:hypothetical protein